MGCAIPIVFHLARGGARIGCTPVRDGVSRVIMINCTPRRTACPRRMAIFRIMRGVPRCPNNVSTVVRFVNGGVGCPMTTRGTGVRKEIIVRFVISGRKGVVYPEMVHNTSPLLSTRTVHLAAVVPG